MERTLGIVWNPDTDSFQVDVKVHDKPMTRRGILSTISQCYDPLGVIQPALLLAKRLLQDLNSCEIGWNEVIPKERKPIDEDILRR